MFTQPFVQTQIKENIKSSAALAFVRGIHRWPVNSPHKRPVTRKCFHLMTSSWPLVRDHLSFKTIFKTIHYCDVLMGAIASQITSLTSAYSTVYSDADQRKHQSSAALAFVQGIHRGSVNSPHKKASNAENVFIWWRHHVFRDIPLNHNKNHSI